jgi:hypothetical protein
MISLRSPFGMALMVLLLLLAISVPSVVMGCSPSYFGRESEMKEALRYMEVVATMDIGQEVIVKLPDNYTPERYWQAKVVDVFKGCGLVAGTSIYVQSNMEASCGVDVQNFTRYMFAATLIEARDYNMDALNYDGAILWVHTAHFAKPLANVTTRELEIIHALPEPICDVANCQSCEYGYFDECSSCDCDGNIIGSTIKCTTNTCPPGTQTTAPVCWCHEFTKVCPDTGVIIRPVGSNFCQLATCPPPRESTGCCPDEPYSKCLEYSQCPDGSFVYRDPSRRCEFPQCNPAPCTGDDLTKTCLDGSTVVSRNPGFGCTFDACPAAPTCNNDQFQCVDGSWVGRDPDHNCQFFQCPLPYGCHALDSCYLVDLTTIPVTEQWLDLTSTSTYRLSSSSSPNGSGKKKKKFSIRCTVVEPIDRLTFYYPNGVKDRHIERFAPYYMRGDDSTTGRIYQVPYLQEGSGCNETKSWTVEGMKGSKVCFNQTVELTAIC